jgi:hypothetical protein
MPETPTVGCGLLWTAQFFPFLRQIGLRCPCADKTFPFLAGFLLNFILLSKSLSFFHLLDNCVRIPNNLLTLAVVLIR